MTYSRHRCREHALQCLYQLEMLDHYEVEEINQFLIHLALQEEAKAFTERLILGTLEYLEAIDQILAENIEKWRLERLSVLVRNLLRLSVFEMKFFQENPFEVIVDEAVILAKDYVDDTARSFVNKVLQNVHDNSLPPAPQFTTSSNGLESLEMPTQQAKNLPLYEEKIQISIPSRLDCVNNVIERLQNVFHSMDQLHQISDPQVLMCIVEALTNAIVHGNLEVPSSVKEQSWDDFQELIETREQAPEFGERTVHFSCHLTTQSLSVKIEDQGVGFDTSSLPDPTDPENLLATSGRGLFLIRVYMDEVIWNEKGNSIHMVKNFQ